MKQHIVSPSQRGLVEIVQGGRKLFQVDPRQTAVQVRQREILIAAQGGVVARERSARFWLWSRMQPRL